MQDSKIEWTDDTVNFWWGCTKISPACQNCYAAALDRRLAGGNWGPSAPRKLRVQAALAELEKIARRGEKEGRPRRVFLQSMSDTFEAREDLIEPRRALWDALHRLSGRLIPLLLTKRPAIMAAWAKEHGWPEGAWAGVTVEDQRRADERIPHLLRVPAPVRFLSMEPLLEPVDLRLHRAWSALDMGLEDDPLAVALIRQAQDEAEDVGDPRLYVRCGLHWVIVGGESGAGARPMHPAWARSIRDQCERAGVPFLFKQWGEWAPDCFCATANPHTATKRPSPGGPGVMFRCGKAGAGRRLDGRTWDELPAGGGR